MNKDLNDPEFWNEIARELIYLYQLKQEDEALRKKEALQNKYKIQQPILDELVSYDRDVLTEIAKHNKLRTLRKQSSLTQKQLAEKLNLKCEDRISHWERGTGIPGLENLMKLCEIFQVTVEDIYPKRR